MFVTKFLIVNIRFTGVTLFPALTCYHLLYVYLQKKISPIMPYLFFEAQDDVVR